MVRNIALCLLFVVFLAAQVASAELVWEPANSGILDIDIRAISVFPGDDNFICAASSKQVYFSENGGKFWREILSFEAEVSEVNFVLFDCFDPETLYLATTEGLFATRNQGEDWWRVFRKVSDEARDVSWIALDCQDLRKVYIGTGTGLYVSADLGATWKKLGGGLPRSEVKSVAVHPVNSQVLYLANTYGLYKSLDSGQSWERVYVTSHRVDEEEGEAESAEEQNLINCIAIDQANPREIFIATGQGVLVSDDSGGSWNKLPTQGLSSDYVNFIVVSQDKGALFAATKNGTFEFLPNLNSWRNLYQGMTAGDIHILALNSNGKQLFAGTDRGVFRVANLKNIQKQGKDEKVKIDKNEEMDFQQVLKEISLNEPTIDEVQEAALRYAEVIHPKNIKALRRKAWLRGFLPTVSLDYDKTVYGSSSTKVGFVGPRDWGLSFSWDVGELVFSEQLRLVDVNARLNVQLRDDILNEVTRLYYERRKLQTELILAPPKTPKGKLIKRLRLEELTANIDGLTGGYFSRNSKFFLD